MGDLTDLRNRRSVLSVKPGPWTYGNGDVRSAPEVRQERTGFHCPTSAAPSAWVIILGVFLSKTPAVAHLAGDKEIGQFHLSEIDC